ncbi:alpha/beta fold hydrolase [Hyphobacterium sp.]|uniref:alpha/beta fold hydrolase n=1 Tax=Hyphobacterium sp. TaxID=2004662 RepID=UPI003747A576
MPIVFLHGGPGSGCTPSHRRYFDPDVFDVVLFDQRGCGRSRPLFALDGNTTQNQIADLESLRKLFGFKKWIVMGPSWGSTLTLAYAQAHPESVSGILVEGVFLATESEFAWWHTEPGAPSLFPDAFEVFMAQEERPERAKISAFFQSACNAMTAEIESGMPVLARMSDTNASLDELRTSLLYRWTEYEDRISWLDASPQHVRESLASRGADFVACHSLIEAHYFANGCFLEPGQLIRDAHRLGEIPMEIVQSRYDVVCPPDAGYRLKQACPHARLTMITRNGHAMTEAVYPAVLEALARLASSAS